MTLATVTSKGQVTIPVDVRNACGVRAGTRLDFVYLGDAQIQVIVQPPLSDLYGIARSVAGKPTVGLGAALVAEDERIRREYSEAIAQ